MARFLETKLPAFTITGTVVFEDGPRRVTKEQFDLLSRGVGQALMAGTIRGFRVDYSRPGMLELWVAGKLRCWTMEKPA